MFSNRKRLHAAVLCLTLIAVQLVVPMVSRAELQADLSRSCSLTLAEKDPITGTALTDVGFTLYAVASVRQGDRGLQYAYTEDFSDNGMSLIDLTEEGLAEHLAAHAMNRDLTGISRDADAVGQTRFSDLSAGLYLVVQHRAAAGYYAARPFLVTLPMQSADGSSWLYDVAAEPKTGTVPIIPQTMRLTVLKRWENISASENLAPISAVLCCDGIPQQTVSLSEQNDWTHTWAALDAAHVWSIAEIDVADGYTVRYETDTDTITIVNVRTALPTPTPRPPLVQTGFQTNDMLLTVAAGLLLLGFGLWFALSKKRQ